MQRHPLFANFLSLPDLVLLLFERYINSLAVNEVELFVLTGSPTS